MQCVRQQGAASITAVQRHTRFVAGGFDPKNQHDETYVVVGILRPSNTPADRVIWIPLQGVQFMTGHDPKASRDLSGVLIKFKDTSPLTARQLAYAALDVEVLVALHGRFRAEMLV